MADIDFAGKVAVVTGASRGIGRVIALGLARRGAAVVGTARRLDFSPGVGGTLEETFAMIEAAGGTAAPRSLAHGARPVIQQIAVNIAKAIQGGTDRIIIQLKPAALGRVEVRLEVTADGRVQAVVTADRPETLEALQRDARGLERALQDAGLRTDSNSLSFNLKQRDGELPEWAAEQGDSENEEPSRLSPCPGIHVLGGRQRIHGRISALVSPRPEHCPVGQPLERRVRRRRRH